MSEVVVKTIPEVPIKLNIFDFSEFPSFTDSTKGIEAIEQHKISIKNGRVFYLTLWGSLIAYVLYQYFTGHLIWALLVALFVGAALVGLTQSSTYKERADEELRAARCQHCWDIANFISDNCIKNSTWFSFRTEAFIYNSDMCAYFSTATGEFVIYSKASIKEVYRERVYVGARTTASGTVSGTSNKGFVNDYYSGTINSASDSRAMYEWHFDVFTDYMPYPKISMVMPDGEFAENSIGKAYGVLKP